MKILRKKNLKMKRKMIIENSELNFTEFEKSLNEIGPFENSPKFAVALSGGVDSMSLLFLTKEFAEKHQGSVIALTLDHSLRSSSNFEAQKVAQIMKSANISHQILEWRHEKAIPSSNIQAKAREARYEILTNFCLENDILHLLTGHNLNDISENFLIRLERGSSSTGLSAMRAISSFNQIQILRPLLKFSKTQIQNFAEKNHLEWVEDPSNKNTKFTRNRIRAAIGHDTHLISRIAKSAFQIGRTEEMISEMADKFFFNHVTISEKGFAEIDFAAFCQENPEITLRILARTLQIVSSATHKARFENLSNLHHGIIQRKKSSFTLSFCQIIIKKEKILIIKELNSPISKLKFGKNIWDGRWVIDNPLQETLLISHLREEKWAKIPTLKKLKIDKRILFTLPCIEKSNGEIIIPHLNHNMEKLPNFQINFKPNWPIY